MYAFWGTLGNWARRNRTVGSIRERRVPRLKAPFASGGVIHGEPFRNNYAAPEDFSGAAPLLYYILEKNYGIQKPGEIPIVMLGG